MKYPITRRDALRAGLTISGTAVAGCLGAQRTGPVLQESFETGLSDWETAGNIDPEEPPSTFEWRIDRSQARAHKGDWSLEIFTEGDHDDGTAWVMTDFQTPADILSFEGSVQAWSPSESFNTLRHLVVYLGPNRPREEGSFLGPGENSSGTPGARIGGLREPLHLAEGWREYTFEWQPATVPNTLYFAVGISVVWEADATHYVDSIELSAT